MTQKQREFLIQNDFKREWNENDGCYEWIKPYGSGVEFVVDEKSVTPMIHMERTYWGSLLSVEAIALKLDYYTNKLNDVSML